MIAEINSRAQRTPPPQVSTQISNITHPEKETTLTKNQQNTIDNALKTFAKNIET